VFLQTSTRDGVRALANYLKRGFVVYATETQTEMVFPPTMPDRALAVGSEFGECLLDDRQSFVE